MAQEKIPASKECRIFGGFGYSNAIDGATGGVSDFLQLDYMVSSNFSLATDFEYLTYKEPPYIPNLPVTPNERQVWNNIFSLLIKCHLPTNAKLKASVGTGWAFNVAQSNFYEGSIQSARFISSTYSEFNIPFTLDANYPIWKALSLGIRIKYNLNSSRQVSTYSTSAGLSLKI